MSAVLVTYYDEDENWIAVDQSRQGCWAAAPDRDEAVFLLGRLSVDYDETFGNENSAAVDNPSSSRSALTTSTPSALREKTK